MNFDAITFTGADDSVSPGHLLEISKLHRWPDLEVEWGILASETSEGSPRWIRELQKAAADAGRSSLSLHLCGRWVRDILMGHATLPHELLAEFDRVQLNFRAEQTPCDPAAFLRALRTMEGDGRQFIFQIAGATGNQHLDSIRHEGGFSMEFFTVPLFDISRGAGVLPNQWPKPLYANSDHGYAGGLGPDNLAEQLPLIAAAAGTTTFWVDMETGVRSGDGKLFDLEKVKRCARRHP